VTENLLTVEGTVTSTPRTTPVTATAAVVQAGVGGDTIANLRGLDPSDAPTLEDELIMVVQFRTIQNPSISAAALTNQLVTGSLAEIQGNLLSLRYHRTRFGSRPDLQRK
jgi:hypothetical protein